MGLLHPAAEGLAGDGDPETLEVPSHVVVGDALGTQVTENFGEFAVEKLVHQSEPGSLGHGDTLCVLARVVKHPVVCHTLCL